MLHIYIYILGRVQDKGDTIISENHSVSRPPEEPLQWRHNGRNAVSNHRSLHCLLSCLLRRRSKKTSNSASLVFVRGIHRWPVNSPHKRQETRKMFPFDERYKKEWRGLSFCQRCFIKNTTCTFWTAVYRYFDGDPITCLIFVTGTVG